MAYSLIDSNSHVDESMEADRTSTLPGTNQVDLLTKNFDIMVLNNSANDSMSDTNINSSRRGVNTPESMNSPQSDKNVNIYLSLLPTKQHKKEVIELAEFHRCLNNANGYRSECVFCKEERMKEKLRNSVKLDSLMRNPEKSINRNTKSYKGNFREISRLRYDERKKKRVSFRF